MVRKILLAIKIFLISSAMNAQTSNDVFELYLDFNEHYLHDQTKAIGVAEQILNSPEKLSKKQEINFYYKLATIYENLHKPEMAVKYFSKVVASEPDFYVPHRALGYLFLKNANPVINKMNDATGNNAEYTKYFGEYRKIVKSALPHLEKATACDPDEETLNLIKKLYQQIKEPDAITTLDARLKKMGENCVTVLTDF